LPPEVAVIARREVLGAAVGAALAAVARHAGAADGSPMPVGFVSHGGPMIAIDPVRGPQLRAWGARLPRPRGVLVMTPHWGQRHLALGATGRGVARYDFPRALAATLPSGMSYATPPSDALAARVEALLRAAMPGEAVERSARDGMDHTTWMPLRHMLPDADVPVLEIAYPYWPEARIFSLGRALAPLRGEGVLVLGSGGMTHNLASVDFDRPPTEVPTWSREFDAWAADRLSARDLDAIVDWRCKAPAAELAHPDDGGHFRALVFAAGAASGTGAGVSFPASGFDLGLSMRAVELG
jgi:4,5-DOPA dioxygenase extradiol